MMDKNREAFEAWWKKPEQAELRSSCSQGWAYYIWHNSIREIEVELPDVKPSVTYTNYGFNWALRECKNSLTSLGIRVKGNEE